MAKKQKKTQEPISYGSAQHIAAIQGAYRIRPEVAKRVVETFESGEREWPYDYYDKCKRMISLIDNPTPRAVSPRAGWKRDKNY